MFHLVFVVKIIKMIKKSIVVVNVPPSFCGKDYQDDKEKYCCGKWAGSTLPEHLRFLHHSILYIISVIIALIITVIINVIILYIISVISVIITVIINIMTMNINFLEGAIELSST